MNEALTSLLAVLNDLGLLWFAAGSVASSIHGLPRYTNDVDLLVDIDDVVVEEVAARVGAEFYMDVDEAKRSIRQGRGFNMMHLATASKIDIFPVGRDSFHRSELARASEEIWTIPGADSIRLVVASAEDTVRSKLRWYQLGGMTSDRQWGDILGVATRRGLDWDYMREWAPVVGVVALLDRLQTELERKVL